ncbi:hypothetical protein [Paraliomyxa miuraensis]|nr:hypothetical protein [Paraliomyxa miuraensis]MCX4246289.1 hypothetical protein [Paraliomyxa miuraensis]
MRTYISVDLDQVIRGESGCPEARRPMTSEAHAATAGAFDTGDGM